MTCYRSAGHIGSSLNELISQKPNTWSSERFVCFKQCREWCRLVEAFIAFHVAVRWNGTDSSAWLRSRGKVKSRQRSHLRTPGQSVRTMCGSTIQQALYWAHTDTSAVNQYLSRLKATDLMPISQELALKSNLNLESSCCCFLPTRIPCLQRFECVSVQAHMKSYQ